MRIAGRRRAVSLLLVLGLATVRLDARDARSGAAPRPADDRLGGILQRTGEYVTRYAETFRNVVAEENYRQWWRDGTHTTARTLRSDLVFVSVPGALPWTTFRDVYEVDGQKVRDREARLEKLFAAPSAANLQAARAIVQESARFNAGDAYRDVNVPTLALLLLRPENQPRLAFELRKGTRRIGGFEGAEVAFEERARPTLIRDAKGRDVPSRGRLWVDAMRGAVLRIEIEYDLEHRKGIVEPARWERAAIATDYRLERGLDVLVPDSMTELYNLAYGSLDCRARYTNYRRFAVTTEWKAKAAGEKAEP